MHTLFLFMFSIALRAQAFNSDEISDFNSVLSQLKIYDVQDYNFIAKGVTGIHNSCARADELNAVLQDSSQVHEGVIQDIKFYSPDEGRLRVNQEDELEAKNTYIPIQVKKFSESVLPWTPTLNPLLPKLNIRLPKKLYSNIQLYFVQLQRAVDVRDYKKCVALTKLVKFGMAK